MDLKEHLLLCLIEECGEVKDILYLEPDNDKELEHELNDIISVAHLLHDNDFVTVNLNLIKKNPSQKYKTGVLHRDIFFYINEIHYFACKAGRFGLQHRKPNNSSRTNKQEIEFFLEELITLLKSDDCYLNLWDRDRLKIKEHKVVAHYKLAIENNTLKV